MRSWEDVIRLFDFISKSIPEINAREVAVGGSSAGGYVARLATLYTSPRPRALCSMYAGECFQSQVYNDTTVTLARSSHRISTLFLNEQWGVDFFSER